MKDHFISVQPIPEPVWFAWEPALSPPFAVLPRPVKETRHPPQLRRRMKAQRLNPAARQMEIT